MMFKQIMSAFGFLRGSTPYMYLSAARIVRKGEEYPRTFVSVAFVVALPVVHVYLKRRSKKRLEAPILAAFTEDIKPALVPYSVKLVQRPVEENRLLNLICPKVKRTVLTTGANDQQQGKGDYFAVVIGPSGTGKTLLTSKVCFDYPFGVLYHEVFNPSSVVQELAVSVGMVLEPDSIVDLALSAISDT